MVTVRRPCVRRGHAKIAGALLWRSGRGNVRARCAAASADAGRPVGVHALVFRGGWDSEAARAAIAGARAAEYDLVEIPLLDPWNVDAQMTRGILDEHGMSATASLGLSLEADINSEEAEVVRRGEELLRAALNATAGFGATHMTGVIYSALDKYPSPPTRAARANCVQALRALANEAADKGVTLGIEAVNRYESNLVNTLAQACELIEEVGAENIVVHADSYHMHIEESSMERAIADAGKRLGYVHIGESHRGFLGSGQCNLDALFDALKEADFTGPLVFESFSRKVVDANLSDRLCVWRDLWDDSDELACHARQWIRERYA